MSSLSEDSKDFNASTLFFHYFPQPVNKLRTLLVLLFYVVGAIFLHLPGTHISVLPDVNADIFYATPLMSYCNATPLIPLPVDSFENVMDYLMK